MPITGECFCGSVQYRINGRVKDARSCHCSRCRKAFSSQASAYALVDADDFEWLNGEHMLTNFLTDQTSDSGFGMSFCSTCGSTLCGTYKGKVHGITLGCLNDDPQIEIGYHLYVGSKASWEVIPQDVTAYQEGPTE